MAYGIYTQAPGSWFWNADWLTIWKQQKASPYIDTDKLTLIPTPRPTPVISTCTRLPAPVTCAGHLRRLPPPLTSYTSFLYVWLVDFLMRKHWTHSKRAPCAFDRCLRNFPTGHCCLHLFPVMCLRLACACSLKIKVDRLPLATERIMKPNLVMEPWSKGK